jgi:hydrogenase maturation protein HypF
VTLRARKFVVTGRVQGVGYRPFVYNTARELGLAGSVLNGAGKVFIHAEGPATALEHFERALVDAAPPLARPSVAAAEDGEPQGLTTFEILASDAASEAEIHVPPDLFTCDDCLAELSGPEERRHHYPFINCTQCGPRYTIITAMPYDRPNTSMAGFPLCEACRAEYESPADRRFHAQPLACPECGPRLAFVGPAVSAGVPGGEGAAGSAPDPLRQTIATLAQGGIVAVKGVGGYHLVCDAASDAAVDRLRRRKHRPHKPLAVMFPWRGRDGLEVVREHLRLDDMTAAALLSPERPIVLAPRRDECTLSAGLAPGLAELGAFLPYSPLHHLLLRAFGRPVVATSGNISGEPVITDNAEAQKRLGEVADAFLHHDRPIVRPADDPVIRPMAGRARPLRLGRGIAPLELGLPGELPRPVLATGGHMKNTVALAWRDRVVVSPHIGDLDSPRSNDVFKHIIKDIQRLYDVNYEIIACDLHPGYASSRWAAQQGQPCIRVQHHAAHASALAGEHPEVEKWLVFTWDGVGYGSDGTLWGGEALAGKPGSWRRVASFRPFDLPGGDKAGREPWRSAAALLWACGRDAAGGGISVGRDAKGGGISVGAAHGRDRAQRALVHEAWRRRINTFESSAVGRLFDAAAALALGREVASFEGPGPMELEQVAAAGGSAARLPLTADDEGILRSDWEPLLDVLVDTSLPAAERAGVFHESMAQALLDQALALRDGPGFDAVGLSGGVFQNRFLTERVRDKLRREGIELRLHRDVPANDGGLCYGQVIEALALL